MGLCLLPPRVPQPLRGPQGAPPSRLLGPRPRRRGALRAPGLPVSAPASRPPGPAAAPPRTPRMCSGCRSGWCPRPPAASFPRSEVAISSALKTHRWSGPVPGASLPPDPPGGCRPYGGVALSPCWMRGWGGQRVKPRQKGRGGTPRILTAVWVTAGRLHVPSPGLTWGLFSRPRHEAQGSRGAGHQPDPSDHTPLDRTPDPSLTPTQLETPRASHHPWEGPVPKPPGPQGLEAAGQVGHCPLSCRPGCRPPRPSCGGRSWSAAWTWRTPWAVWRRPSRGEAGRARPAGLQGACRQGRCPRLLATPPERLRVRAGGAEQGGAGATHLGLSLLPVLPLPRPPHQLGQGFWPVLQAGHQSCL